MFKRLRKAELPERRDPGDRQAERCGPGSIEQKLDMCEEGELRGDLVENRKEESLAPDDETEEPLPVDREMDTFNVDMSEARREGDEMSGDDHSSGLQGGEPDIQGQAHQDTGIPGQEFVPDDDSAGGVVDNRQDPRDKHSFTKRRIHANRPGKRKAA